MIYGDEYGSLVQPAERPRQWMPPRRYVYYLQQRIRIDTYRRLGLLDGHKSYYSLIV